MNLPFGNTPADPIHPVAKRLILIRGLRSIGQGAMVVDLTLYLKAIHWSGASIGGVTSAAGLVGAALILVVGVLSDRMGRRPFLLIYEFLTTLSALAACLTSSAILLVFAIVVAGFGRGQSGGAGPFSPAEQAWLARVVKQKSRGQLFSWNSAIGFLGMALGSVIGGVPQLVHGGSPLANYRPIFLLVAAISITCVILLLFTPEEPMRKAQTSPEEHSNEEHSNEEHSNEEHSNEGRSKSAAASASRQQTQEQRIRRKENRSLLTLAAINTLNGLAVGLTGPMMAYWFSIRYGASTASIGATLSLGFLATGLFSILNGLMVHRVGLVKSVTWMRVIGSILMFAIPWMPSFFLASALYIVRNAVNRGTQGNRTALSASLTRDERRGLGTSINALSMRLPSSIGPTITGYLFDMNELALPLILTSVLQLANAGLYQWAFRRYDKAQPEN